MCELKRTTLDVIRHERCDHGAWFPFGKPQEARARNVPQGLTSLADLEVPREVVQLMGTAESTYAQESNMMDVFIPGIDFLERVDLFG